jgi:hypothetical protein
MSPAIRTGRRRILSNQAPAGSVKRMNGSISIAASSAISNGVAFRTMAAMYGIAIRLTWLPIRLTVDAVQSFM